jgi:hypothetical protein
MGLLAGYTFKCPTDGCSELLATRLSSCPNCGFSLSPLITPASPQASVKRIKHTEVILTGTVSVGTGPSGYNASFDHNGLASVGEVIRYTVAFGHRGTISSGPGRTPSDAIVAYLPETIGSGTSNFQSGLTAVSGLCIFSPASPTWGHAFPAMDAWIQGHTPLSSFVCARCHGPTSFGHAFCSKCSAEWGLDWRLLLR